MSEVGNPTRPFACSLVASRDGAGRSVHRLSPATFSALGVAESNGLCCAVTDSQMLRLDAFLSRYDFREVHLVMVHAEAPDEELVLGWIGQFWRLRGRSSPKVGNAHQFIAFETPGYAKAIINFKAERTDGST